MYKFLILIYVLMREISSISTFTVTQSEELHCDCSLDRSLLDSFLTEQTLIRTLIEDLHAKEQKNTEQFQNELRILKSSLDGLHVQQEAQMLKLNALNTTFNAALVTLKEHTENLLAQHQLKDKTQNEFAVKPFTQKMTINELSADLPTNCARKNNIFTIKPEKFSPEPFEVACEHNIQGGDWIVIQRRQDGSVNFQRNWTEYKTGFGDLNGEFWLGLDKIHALTTSEPQELLIVIEDFENKRVFAKYDDFEIGNETEAYVLKVLGKYTGDASDSLAPHKGMKFSTNDVDNDNAKDENCAITYTGAWWYNKCYRSNLNGQYLRGVLSEKNKGKGVDWNNYRMNYSLKFVQMMIRSKSK